MSDRPIQLDASFDARAHYTILVWLRPRDAVVHIGEPVVVVVDGALQRVISAPCSGRIVSVYADEGARVLPRTIIGMIRPNVVLPDLFSGSRTGVVAGAVIVLTVALVTFANAAPNVPLIQLPTFSPAEQTGIAPTATGVAAPSSDVTDATAYPEPVSDAPVDVAPPTDQPVSLPTDPALATPEGPIDATPQPVDELPRVEPTSADPFDTGIDVAAERMKVINMARQAAQIAVGSAPYFKPGIVDDTIWSSTLESNLFTIKGYYDQIAEISRIVSNVSTQREVLDELDRVQAEVGNCMEPFQIAELSRANGSEISGFKTQFTQCQQFLDTLPEQS